MSTGELITIVLASSGVLLSVGIAYGVIVTRMDAHETLDSERHSGVEKMFEEIRADVKTLLAR